MNMTAFWDIAPCSLVEVGDVSEVLLLDDGGRTFETSAYFYRAKRRNIPEGCHLHTRHREN
jgi:hypothetical protein